MEHPCWRSSGRRPGSGLVFDKKRFSHMEKLVQTHLIHHRFSPSSQCHHLTAAGLFRDFQSQTRNLKQQQLRSPSAHSVKEIDIKGRVLPSLRYPLSNSCQSTIISRSFAKFYCRLPKPGPGMTATTALLFSRSRH